MVRVGTLLDWLGYAAALLGVAPLFVYLDRPAQLLFPAALVLAVVCDRRGRYFLKPSLATPFAIACFLLYALQVSRDHLVEPVVNVLALLLAVRLATEKSGRHYLQLFVLSVFALAASTLLTLSAFFLLLLVLQVTGVTVGLVLLTFHAVEPQAAFGRRESGRVLSVALLLPAASLVLMLGFFVVLPRTQTPLWNFLNPPQRAETGFSEEVRPGAFAAIAAVKNVAFRVECERLSPEDLYWRGTVLNALEGSSWVRRPPPAEETARVTGGRRIAQTVYPEPTAGHFLFALDLPREIEGIRAARAPDLVFRTPSPLERRLKYGAVSVAGGTLEVAQEPDLAFYLAVPQPPSARVRAVAEEIVARGGSDADKIARLEAFFAAQQLAYATSDLPGGPDPVDAFLFEKRRGYCEFFASSFAVLLRLCGVPARLVGGYYGGSYNELGGYYVVTEEAAHAWVEALVEGRWLRLDPSRLAHNAAAALVAPRERRIRIDRSLADAVNYYWNRLVITYDLGRQLQLLHGTGVQLRRLRLNVDLRRTVGWLAALAVGGAAVAALVRRLRTSAEKRLLQAFLRQVRRRHRLAEIPHEVGLHALAERLNDPACRQFAAIYGGALYRDRRLTREERRRLRELIRGVGRG